MRKFFYIVSACFLCLVLGSCGEQTPCGHVFKITAITDASCEQSGSKTIQCTLCGITYTEEIPADGHVYSEANCTTAKNCRVCGKTEGKPLDHDWKEAYCVTPKTCKTCGQHSGEAIGHHYSAATCTEPGICTNCGEKVGDPLGHDWVDAMCTTPKTCVRCQITEGSTLDHDWSDATCAMPKTCHVCGQTEGTPLGHAWIDATCTTPKTCTTCGQNDGEPLGHGYSVATCTAPQTCLSCGVTTGEALGHEYQSRVVKNGSCDEHGQLQYICNRCAHSYEEEYVPTPYTAAQIYELYKNTVGEIITYDEYDNELAVGTCVVYSSNGKLITNYHVLEGAHSARVKIGSQYYTVQYVLAYDKYIDLAILEINATGLQPAVLCNKTHATGKTVFAIGSSYGLSFSLSQGIISYASREINGVNYVQHNAAMSEGNSGGPLINEYGEVIGINTMSLLDAQNLNFAISVSALDKLSGSKMTMKEFNDAIKENDPFLKMKNYIVGRGTYDADYKCYQLRHGYGISGDFTTVWEYYSFYHVEEDIITLEAVVNGGAYWMAIVILPDIDGVFEWSYADMSDRVMGGMIEARVFDNNTLLKYAYNNISNDATRSSVKRSASSMVRYLLSNFNTYWRNAGVKAKDLNFMQY